MTGHDHRHEGVRAALALLTVSDTRTPENDRSGNVARELVEQAGHRVVDYRIVPDEPDLVARRVRAWLDRGDCEAVVVNGGTGVSKRDRTIEALDDLFETRLDGFGELFRMLSFEQIGAAAMLSRAAAGVSGGKPIFAVPGSPEAVRLALERLILPTLGHLLGELRR